MSNKSHNGLRPGQRVILSMNGRTYPATVKELQPAGMVDIIRDDRAPNPERRPVAALSPLRTNSGAPRASVARFNGAAQEISGGTGKAAEAAARKEAEKAILPDYAANLPPAYQALGLRRLPITQDTEQALQLSFRSEGAQNNELIGIVKTALNKFDHFVNSQVSANSDIRRDTIGFVGDDNKEHSTQDLFTTGSRGQKSKAEEAIANFAHLHASIGLEAQRRVIQFLKLYINFCVIVKIKPVELPSTTQGLNREFFGQVFAQLLGLRTSLEAQIAKDSSYNKTQADRISILAAIYSLIYTKAQVTKILTTLTLPVAEQKVIATFLTRYGYGGFAPTMPAGVSDFAAFISLPSCRVFSIQNPDFGDVKPGKETEISPAILGKVQSAFFDATSPIRAGGTLLIQLDKIRSLSYFRWAPTQRPNLAPVVKNLPKAIAGLISVYLEPAFDFFSIFLATPGREAEFNKLSETPGIAAKTAEVLYRVAELGNIANKKLVITTEDTKDTKKTKDTKDTQASTEAAQEGERASISSKGKADSKYAQHVLTKLKQANQFNINRAIQEERNRIQGQSFVGLISQTSLKAAYTVAPDPARYPKNPIPRMGPAQTCGNPLDGLAYLVAYGGDQQNVAITLTYEGLANLRSARNVFQRQGKDEDAATAVDSTEERGGRTQRLSSVITAKSLSEMALFEEGARSVATADRADPEAEFASSGSAVSARARLRAEDLNFRMKSTGKNVLPPTSTYKKITQADIDNFMHDPANIDKIQGKPEVERMLLEVKGLIASGAVNFVQLVAQEKAPRFKAAMVAPELQTDFSRHPRPRDPSQLERLSMVSRVPFSLDTPILIQKEVVDQQKNVHTEIRQFKITINRDVGRDKFERFFLPYTKAKRGEWAKSNNPFYAFTPEQAGESQQWFLTEDVLKHLSPDERTAIAKRREELSCLSIADVTRIRTLKDSFERYNRTLNTVEYNTKRLGDMGAQDGDIPYVLRLQLKSINVSSLLREGNSVEGVSVTALTQIGALRNKAAVDYKFENPISENIKTVFGSLCSALGNMRLAIPVDEEGNTSFPEGSDSAGEPYKPAVFNASNTRPASDYTLVAEFLKKEMQDRNSVITKMQEVISRSQAVAINTQITRVDRKEMREEQLANLNESIQRIEERGGTPSERQLDFRESLERDLAQMDNLPDSERYWYQTKSEPMSLQRLCGAEQTSGARGASLLDYAPSFEQPQILSQELPWHRIRFSKNRIKKWVQTKNAPAALSVSLSQLIAETLLRDSTYFETYPGMPAEWREEVKYRFNHAQIAVTALETLRLLGTPHIESWLHALAPNELQAAKEGGYNLRQLEPYVGLLGSIPVYSINAKDLLRKGKKFETSTAQKTRDTLRALDKDDADLYTYTADPARRDFALKAVSLIPIAPQERADWIQTLPVFAPEEFGDGGFRGPKFREMEATATKLVCEYYLKFIKDVQSSRDYIDNVNAIVANFESPGRGAAARRTITALMDLIELLLTLVVSTPTDIASTDDKQYATDSNTRVKADMIELYVQHGCFLRSTTRASLLVFFLADVFPLVGTTTKSLENELNTNIGKLQADLSRGNLTKEDFKVLGDFITTDSAMSNTQAAELLKKHLNAIADDIDKIDTLTRKADAIELPSQTVDQMAMTLERNRKASMLNAEKAEVAAQRLGEAIANEVLAFVRERTQDKSKLALRLRLAGDQDAEEYANLINTREALRVQFDAMRDEIYTQQGTKRKKIAADAERRWSGLHDLFAKANDAVRQYEQAVTDGLVLYAKALADDIYFDLMYDDNMKLRGTFDTAKFESLLADEGLFSSIEDLSPQEKSRIERIGRAIMARASAEDSKAWFEELGTKNQIAMKAQISQLQRGITGPLRLKMQYQEEALTLSGSVSAKTQQIVDQLQRMGKGIAPQLAYRVFLLSHDMEINNKKREVDLLQKQYLTQREERNAYLNEENKFQRRREETERELKRQQAIYRGEFSKDRSLRSPRLNLIDLLAAMNVYMERYAENFKMTESDQTLLRERVGTRSTNREMVWGEAYSLLTSLNYEDLAAFIVGSESFVSFRARLESRVKPKMTQAAASDIVTEGEAQANVNLLRQMMAADVEIQEVNKDRQRRNKAIEAARKALLEKANEIKNQSLDEEEKAKILAPLELKLFQARNAPLSSVEGTQREDDQVISRAEREKAYRRIYELTEQLNLINSFYQDVNALRKNAIVSPGAVTDHKIKVDRAKEELNRLKAATWTGVNPVTREPLPPNQVLTYADLVRLGALQSVGASVYTTGVQRLIAQGKSTDATLAQQFRAVQQQFLSETGLAVTTGMAAFNATSEMRKENIRIVRTYNPVLFKIVTTFWDSQKNIARWGDFSQHPELAEAVDAVGLYGTLLHMTMQAEALAKAAGAHIGSYEDLLPFWHETIDRYCEQYRIVDPTNVARILIPAWVARLNPALSIERREDFVNGMFADPFNMILGKGPFGEIFRIKERALIAFDAVGRIGTSLTTRKNELEAADISVADLNEKDRSRRINHILRIVETTFRGWLLSVLQPTGVIGGFSTQGLAELKSKYPWVLVLYGISPNEATSSDIMSRVINNPLTEDNVYRLALPFLRDVIQVPSLQSQQLQNLTSAQLFEMLLKLENKELQRLFTHEWRFEATKPDFSRTMPPIKATIASSYSRTSSMPEWHEKAIMKNSLLRLIDKMLTDSTSGKT